MWLELATFLGPIVAAALGVMGTLLALRWREARKLQASQRIERDTRQKIGSLRGHQVTVLQFDRPTFVVSELARATTWVKKGDELGSVFSARRDQEVSAIEFPVLRQAVELDLSRYDWLPRPFLGALELVLSSVSAGVRLPLAQLSEPEAAYATQLRDLERDLRVSHLLLPEIRRAHHVQATPDEKWKSVEGYFLNLADGSGLFFVGEKPLDDHLHALEQSVKYKLVVPKVIEARGRHTNKAAALVAAFTNRNRNWCVKRVDISTRGMGEDDYRTSQLWMELVMMDGEDVVRLRQQRSGFVRLVEARSATPILFGAYQPLSVADRTEIYTQMWGGIRSSGFATLCASGEGVSNCVFVAAVFGFLNPSLDYYCTLDDEDAGGSKLYVCFSTTSLADLFSAVASGKG